MRIIQIITLSILLFSCKTQADVLTNSETKQTVENNLKKNEFFVVVGQRRKTRTDSSLKETILLIGEKKYFVKFDEGYVSEEKLLKYLNKKIKIKGEIKNGSWEANKSGSIIDKSQSIKGRSGEYIVVYRILDN
ncbi:MAG: hypothetical protein HYU68_02970 [Bacteroidetes bacterium]|nr:hypothetical protein [Bacteroidota bacterium]